MSSTDLVLLEDFQLEEQGQSLRPKSLDQFIGQDDAKDRLREPVEAAKLTGKPLRHVLLTGGPGLGKTTLGEMLSGELGTSFVETTGDEITDPGTLLKLLLMQEDRGVFFIDEVHLLPPRIMQALYKALEQGKFPVVIGRGPSAETEVVQLPRFTLVAATTDTGKLTDAFLQRMKLRVHLDLYSDADLLEIAVRSANVHGYTIDYEAARMMSVRARGTPRDLNSQLEGLIDHAHFYPCDKDKHISAGCARSFYRQEGIDELGLKPEERQYLHIVCTMADGSRIGIKNIAGAMREQIEAVEEIEQYLIHRGMVIRSVNGRYATDLAYAHLNLKKGFQPHSMMTQAELDKIANSKRS